ncbi:MAG: transcription elongation factor GreA [bacterium]|nr:transcription elongation factor GreA [bacterium]
MQPNQVILSAEGLKKLEQELEHLKSVRRREIAERIKQAREFGDITENSEYENVKNEQAFVEGRILTLERLIRNAVLLDEIPVNYDTVGVGCRVRLEDLDRGQILEYAIVGSAEADPRENRISNESPVARALLGHGVGAELEVLVPAGTLRYRILEVLPLNSPRSPTQV